MPRRILDLLRRIRFRKEKPLVEMQRVVPRPRVASTTWYKDNVSKKHFSIVTQDKFLFKDKYPKEKVRNSIIPFESNENHLILCDKLGIQRVVLSFIEIVDTIEISSIQRIRTQYKKDEEGMYDWSPELETESAKQFALELGLHLSEFLLCEFLHIFSKQIKDGKKIRIQIYKSFFNKGNYVVQLIYSPILDRFFKPKPVVENNTFATYELSLDKQRVKSILGV